MQSNHWVVEGAAQQGQLTFRNLTLALRDIKDGLLSVHIWSLMGWQEIRQRYRRSLLGPFWLTLSTAALVAGMGPLYGKLLGRDISSYFPYLAMGFIVWQFLANLINESCYSFIIAESFIKQTRLPYTIHVARVVWRNLIVLAHNIPILIVMYAFFRWPLSVECMFLAAVAVALLCVNALWMGLLLGILCARFRDVPPIVSSVVQIGFFLTPVMWHPEQLGKYNLIVQYNPLYYMLDVLRLPLLGTVPAPSLFFTVIGISVAGLALALVMFAKFRVRISYWV